MSADLLNRKKTHFVLWLPGDKQPTPTLYIGTISPNSNSVENVNKFELSLSEGFTDLWEIAASKCELKDGQVYFYWFKVGNTDPYNSADNQVILCTDPIAYTVDRRLEAPLLEETGSIASGDPASVVLYKNGELVACDPGGEIANWSGDTPPSQLPQNNKLIIYELPTRWTRIDSNGGIELGNGTFRDVLALLESKAIAPTFPTISALNNRAHLVELGINALELLPPADSDDYLEWGYGTSNYFAADFNLGLPDSQTVPTASVDLVNLIKTCHQNNLRFFVDAVMAFSRNNPYHNINFLDFYVQFGSGDPEQNNRDGFGGDLFKYNRWVEGYHPITGKKESLVPAREYMKAYLTHWMEYYRVDGWRLDSVNNVANYDFIQEFKETARSLWEKRGGSGVGRSPCLRHRFLVVGEELSVPLALLEQNRLDGLWNEKFKQIVRQVILGNNWSDEPSFEWSVRKLIDCRNLGFKDGTQAVNYLTSHDVSGLGNERFYNWLNNNQVFDTERRIKLAFVCLLTAVGIPMILAGDEFADQQDLDISSSPDRDRHKQIDPINYSRMQDDWRRRIFDYVARLIRFRRTSDALAVNDTQFIHVDFNEGKRVVVWQRGKGDDLVVVVANFSDYGTPNADNPNSKYIVPFPATPENKQWQEVTQGRIVPTEWVGKEPIFPWEAKVYALV